MTKFIFNLQEGETGESNMNREVFYRTYPGQVRNIVLLQYLNSHLYLRHIVFVCIAKCCPISQMFISKPNSRAIWSVKIMVAVVYDW